ncbi:MAG: maltotransferase domain-containing protein [Vicinamibacterales bacterium]
MNEPAGRGLPAPVPRDRRRVVIEDVAPAVDGGRFPIKRVVGEPIDVEADVFADGDDTLRVLLRHRVIGAGASESPWHTMPMRPIGDDRWTARFVPDQVGYAEYAVVAWVDTFTTWRQALGARHLRGEDVASDLLEGAELVRRAANAARSGLGGRPSATREAANERLLDRSAQLRAPTPAADRVAIALSADLAADMAAWGPAADPVTHVPLRARIERADAATPAWARIAADTDAPARLPGLLAIGADIVCLDRPAYEPVPTDADGRAGLDALRRAAADAGLELALPLRFECPAGHPRVGEHPEWFHRRPDGTFGAIRPANGGGPDRLPFDFTGDAWETLWEDIRRGVLAWVGAGIRAFRAEAPHHAPFAFWEWLIAEIHREHPDVIFFAGEDGRPKAGRRLAKIGFTQSAIALPAVLRKPAVMDLVRSLAARPARECQRAVIVDPAWLATGPAPVATARARARVRLVLAATLGAAFELPGALLDTASGGAATDLAPLATVLARLRRGHPAFAAGSRAVPLETDNERLAAWARVSADGAEHVVIVVNLDADHMQHGWLSVPAAAWGYPALFGVLDDLTGERYVWQEGRNYVRLEPARMPAHLLILTPSTTP